MVLRIEMDTALVDVIGDKTAAALDKQLELTTVGDLLHHYPRRYDERGQLTDLAKLTVGDDVTVMASIQSVSSRQYGNPNDRRKRKTMIDVVVTDGRGRLALTFFNAAWRGRDLVVGRTGLFAGKVTEFRGKRQLTNPEYVLTDGLDVDDYAGAIIPVYSATSKMPTWTIAKSVRIMLDRLDTILDPLPSQLRAEYGLAELDRALRSIHRPEDRAQIGSARRRLAWDEALGVQLTLAQRRHASSVNPAYPRARKAGGLADAFDAMLPFELTAGQLAVGAEVAHDLGGTHPMHRLLQGEVGSGKTVVALRAMLQVIDAGAQAALLAPTEVLASQHARSIEAMLGPLAQAGQFGAADDATRVTLLTGSLSVGAKRSALLQAASGEAGIVIGTHALIQQTVHFAELGLVVVDEQHRFGVEQRDALRAKSAAPPHLLVMTATPIPRTVAMTVFGDLDVSTLAELPRGRAPITTNVVPVGEKPAWLDRAWQRVREEVAAGRQAYVVCPRIGDDAALTNDDGDGGEEPFDERLDDERAPTQAVLAVAQELSAGPLSDVRLDILHGRLVGDQKDAVMRRFAGGDIDVLVATTVIEVGVDVPNATVMVIMNADRFGVSQLHQLRGRVGRGGLPGLCLLVTDSPAGSPARERLTAVADSTDGFVLAELDLSQRHEGDILGTSQSGRRRHLKLLSLLRDKALIEQAREAASKLVAGDPSLQAFPLLAQQVAALVEDERSQFLDKA
jgi:ATP-dependent DNA helicase RecG